MERPLPLVLGTSISCAKKHNPSFCDYIIRSWYPRVLSITLGSCTDVWCQAHSACCSGPVHGLTPPPSLNDKQISVMQTSSHFRTSWRCGSSVLEPIRPTCDLQMQNTNRTDWKRTRPTCYTYAPLRPHEQIVSPLLSIGVKSEWSHTSAPTTCLHDLDMETLPFAVQFPKSA